MNVIRFLVAAFLLVFFQSCSALHEKKIDIELTTYMQGTLLLYNSEFVFIDSESTQGKNETVGFHFNATSPDFYFIVINSKNKIFPLFGSYYLTPGDSLRIDSEMSNTTLTGNAASLNNFESGERYNISSSGYNNRLYLSPKEACAVIDSVRYERESYLEEFSKIFKVPLAFKTFHKELIYQKWCADYFDYITYHNYYTHDDFTYLSLDSLTLSFKDSLHFKNQYNYTPTYANNLKNYIKFRFHEISDHIADSIKYQYALEAYINLIQKEFEKEDQEVAYESFASEIVYHLGYHSQEKFFSVLEPAVQLAKNSTNDYLRYSFIERYDALKSISSGNIAADFTLKNVEGDDITLSDYRGKIVSLNFWGTWCPPCIASIPKHIELHKRYSDNEIVFLNIALEYDSSDVERWKKFVEDKGYTGVHLVAEKQFYNSELAPYLLNSAPTYMLIGKRGEIIEARSKPPYDNTEQIDSLLGKK